MRSLNSNEKDADNDGLDLVEKYRSFQQRQNQIIEDVKSRRTHSHPYHPQYLENLRKQMLNGYYQLIKNFYQKIE